MLILCLQHCIASVVNNEKAIFAVVFVVLGVFSEAQSPQTVVKITQISCFKEMTGTYRLITESFVFLLSLHSIGGSRDQ